MKCSDTAAVSRTIRGLRQRALPDGHVIGHHVPLGREHDVRVPSARRFVRGILAGSPRIDDIELIAGSWPATPSGSAAHAVRPGRRRIHRDRAHAFFSNCTASVTRSCKSVRTCSHQAIGTSTAMVPRAGARRTEWAREQAEKLSDTVPAVEGTGDARAGVHRGPESGSVWRVPGMPWLLASATLWMAGFALLMPVAPLWVIHGGSDDLGAGLVTGVMMACTVLAQLSMRRVLAGLGWRWTLALGSGLLGLPALGHLVTDGLWTVVALAALRGLGFGAVTVCGAT